MEVIPPDLELLGTCVPEVGLETKFRWELGEAVGWIHFNAVVHAARFVRRLEGAAVSWASEGEELVEAVTKALEATVGAVDNAEGPASFATVRFVLANDLLRNFDHSVEDVANGTTKLAGRGVSVSWRSLNVGGSDASEGQHGGSCNEEFFHVDVEKVGASPGAWQRESVAGIG